MHRRDFLKNGTKAAGLAAPHKGLAPRASSGEAAKLAPIAKRPLGFDLYQFHYLTTLDDVETVFGPDGAMETFQAAKKAGKVRFFGFSAHSVEAALAAMDRYEFDTILFPINFVLFSQANFGPQVLEKARKKGNGYPGAEDDGEDHLAESDEGE
jgi:aryl-alcohol dehydrogenase-like predicted oxidoreductase